jgi:hypothetical protein
MNNNDKRFQVIYDGNCIVAGFHTKEEADEYMSGWDEDSEVLALLVIKELC